MSFQDLQLKEIYRSPADDVVREVFIPALSEAVCYKRSVGFFSSSALEEVTVGISSLVAKGGRIEMIASPKLSEEDVEAIKVGYAKKDEVVRKRLFNELVQIDDDLKKTRLNYLANLIANGILTLKIAVVDDFTENGIYHEKIGVFEDVDGNKIAIEGSMNESVTAMRHNFERLTVYCDWILEDKKRAQIIINDYENLWNDKTPSLKISEFKDLSEKIIQTYKYYDIPSLDYDPDKDNESVSSSKVESSMSYDSLRPYQKKAIDAWIGNGARGVYDMATGTGKTLTALFSLQRLREECKDDLCVIILCPYIHLVSQWIKDIEKFDIRPIIAFGSSPQKDWQSKLKKAVEKRNYFSGEKGFFCLISTIASFKREFIQQHVSKIKKSCLLIADEAHNLGSQGAKKYLVPEKFDYRLALSATLERHFDQEGTDFLYDFFGPKCIEYGLERAIQEGYLTPYEYHPVIVTLDESERDCYKQITEELRGEIRVSPDDHRRILSERGKMLAIERSRIIAGAKGKLHELINLLANYHDKNRILIYCGATKYEDDVDSGVIDAESSKQIEMVLSTVYERYAMRMARFTAEKNVEERQSIIDRFENQDLQAIVAIKCLDEGVNIPMIETAFILASSTNPKEYIQRRGRVLRLYPGKEKAVIYDFVTLPYSVSTASNKELFENAAFSSLIENEIVRMEEFSNLSMNKVESLRIIDQLKELYKIDGRFFTEEFDYE